jgi:hypothetical protein
MPCAIDALGAKTAAAVTAATEMTRFLMALSSVCLPV